MKNHLHFLVVLVFFSFFVTPSFSQCPPTLTLTPRGANVTITGNNVNLCPGEAVQLDASPSGGVTYQWYKGAELQVDSTFSHFWAKEIGSYTVVVSGCGTASVPVVVTHKAQPEFTITTIPTPPHICAQQPITLTVSATPWNANWVWMSPPSVFGTNTNPLTPPLLNSTTTFQLVGTHPVTSCPNTSTMVVTVDDIINGGTIMDNQEICAGVIPGPFTEVTPASGGGGPGTYTYSWAKSTVSALGPWTSVWVTTPNYTPTSAIYQTTWYMRNTMSPPCSAGSSNVVMVTVNETPMVTSASTKTICSETSVAYQPTSNIALTTFTWTAVVQPGPAVNGVTLSGSGYIGDILSLNAGVTTHGVVKYTITPAGPGTTACPGIPKVLTVTVNPIPSVTITDPSQTICSGGSTTQVNLASGVSGVTWDWYSTNDALITPVVTGTTAYLPAQVFTSTRTDAGYVTYHVRATGPDPTNCASSYITYTVQVNPALTVTNSPMEQSICSEGTSANVILESNVPGTTFTWTASASPGTLFGFDPSGTNTIPPQTITNPGTTLGTVTYHVTPIGGSLGSCPVTPRDYLIYVHPKPAITSALTGTVCSNSPYNYTITSGVASSTFTWSRTLDSRIFPSSNSGTGFTINETLINLTTNPVDVTYVLTPTGPAPMSCAGTPSNLIVTVKPQPIVSAGPDKPANCGTSVMLEGTATPGTGVITSIAWVDDAYLVPPKNILQPTTTNLNSSQIFTLTVTDGGGCTNSDVVQVNVTGSCLSVNPSATPQTICVGQTSHLSANPFGGSGTYTSYAWTCNTDPSWSSALANPDVSPTSTTIYTVVVNDGFSTISGSVTVTVNPLPIPYAVNGGGEYCSGTGGVAIGLANSESSTVHYQLNCSNPAHTPVELPGTGAPLSFGNFTLAGSYTVAAHNSVTGCINNMTGSVTVTINPLPTASAGPNQTINNGMWTTLAGSATGGATPYGYLWSPSASIKPGQTTLPNPETKNLTVNTQFTLTVTDNKGCVSTSTMWVYVDGDPLSVTTSATPQVICNNGATVSLTSTVSGGSLNYDYSWTSTPAGFTSILPSPTDQPVDNIIYHLTVWDHYNYGYSDVAVTVNPLPTIYNVTGGGSYCQGGLGVPVGLDNSTSWIRYRLFRGGIKIDSMMGTGSLISFGNQTVAMTYTIQAYNPVTGCTNAMIGNAVVTILPPPTFFTVTGGGSYPAGGTGVPVGLSGSQTGVEYKLVKVPDFIVPSVWIPGTGFPLNFGNQTEEGVYFIQARNTSTLCEAEMSGSVSVIVNPLPQIFNVFGGGEICYGSAGTSVGLTGSELTVQYELRRGTTVVDTKDGTGLALDFSPLPDAGVYTIRAIIPLSGAFVMMTGSATITVNPLPIAYLLVPQGDTCSGTEILINGSQAGVTYNLMMGAVVMASVPGTGASGLLSFGHQTATGTYHVEGVNNITGCGIDMTGTVTLYPSPDQFTLNPPGILCPGEELILSGSQIGINYQLRRDSLINASALIPGTSLPINFGPQIIPGVYSVVAINPLTHCYSWQIGRDTIHPAPMVFNMLPVGDTCSGGTLRLNGSQIGRNYHVVLNNVVFLDSLYGTGGPLVFGTHYTSGNYRILAVDTATHCESWMTGTVNISASPIAYEIIPNGIGCAGDPVGLDDSEIGVSYTLILDGWIVAAGPIPGTGSAISFGNQLSPGFYTITAVADGSLCTTEMTGGASLSPKPTPYLIQPQGIQCAGTSIYLNGSQTGINYSLKLGSVVIDVHPGNGGILDFGPQYLIGTYTILAVNPANTCYNEMTGTVIITPLPLAFNITPASGSANCAPAAIGLDGSQTGATYQLFKDGASFGSPVSGSGFPITFGLQQGGTYYVVATLNTTPNCELTMTGAVTVTPLPTVSAGNDSIICAGVSPSITLKAIATNHNTSPAQILWEDLSGIGSFSNANSLITQYFPGTTPGNRNLRITVHGINGCFNATATDIRIITVNAQPVIIAGNDQTVCANVATVTMAGYSFTGATGATWHGGSGLWAGDVYTPTAFEKAAGSVILSYTTNTADPCSEATDNMTVTFQPLPTISAGPDQNVCASVTSVTMAGFSHTGATGATWSGGAGAWAGIVYTPTAAEKLAGSVTLTYTTSTAAPCSNISDEVVIHFQPLPVIMAGPDQNICVAATTVTMTGYSYTGATGATWHGGAGTWSSDIYTPTPAEKAAGSVVLTYTTNSAVPCSEVSDNMTVTFQALPVITAGLDQTVCADIPSVTMTGYYYSGATGATWTGGAGTWVGDQYSPTATERSIGTVTLRYITSSASPCSEVYDDKVVHFQPLPAIFAGPDQTVCADVVTVTMSNYYFTEATSAYWHGGAGTWNGDIYTPTSAEKQSGSVILSFTTNTAAPCSEVTDEVTIFFHVLPTIAAGDDQLVCSDVSTVTMAGFSFTGATGATWSGGNGSWNGNIYTPTPFEKSAGLVTLTYTTNSASPCAEISDNMVVHFQPAPLINAGPDQVLCADEPFVTMGGFSYSGASGAIWSGGTGSWAGIYYTPTPAEKASGSVVLTYTTNSATPCSEVSESMLVTFHPLPVIEAGPDQSVCADVTEVTMAGYSYTGATGATWSGGSGSWTGDHYTPTPAEKLAGSVSLIYSTASAAPCQETNDGMTVNFLPLPTPTVASGQIQPCINKAFQYATQPGMTGYTWEILPLNTYTYTFPNPGDMSVIEITWTTIGARTIRVNYMNSYGCISPGPSPVYAVDVILAPVPTIAGNNIVCLDDINTYSTESNMTNYAWIVTGGVITAGGTYSDPYVTVNWNTAGIKNISVTYMAASGCIPIAPTNFQILVSPAPTPTVTGLNSVCTGATGVTYLTESGMSVYTWNISSGGTISGGFGTNTITVNWNTQGPQWIEVSYISTYGCETITPSQYSVTVNPQPVPLLSGPATACQGGITYEYITDVGMSNYIWTVSSGGTIVPNGNVATVTWNTPGPQSVSVTYTSTSGCIAQSPTIKTVNVYPQPVPTIMGPATVCLNSGGSAGYTYMTEAGMTGYTWVPSSGGTIVNGSGTSQVVITWNSPGTQSVSVSYANTYGCTPVTATTYNVLVNDSPLADFHADTACFGSSTHFIDDSEPNQGTIVSWVWNFGDGSANSMIQDPVHLYGSAGIFNVTLQVTTTLGCTNTIVKQVKVNALPTAAFSFSNAGCAGVAVNFNDMSFTPEGYIVRWTWEFGDGTSTTITFPNPQNTSHIYASGGTYSPVLTVKTSDSCTASVTHTITINDTPLANFEFATTRCQGSPIQFTDLSQLNGGGQIISWSWDFDDPGSGISNHSTQQNPLHVFQQADDYHVILIVQNINNCSDTISKTVTIHATPYTDFLADTVCRGDSTHFDNLSTAGTGNIISWYWEFGDGITSSLENPAHKYSAAGVYAVKLTVMNSENCVHDTTRNVLVKEIPDANFTFTDGCTGTAIQFTDLSVTGGGYINSWLWKFGDGGTSTLQNPTHTYAAGGTYNVTLTVGATTGCYDSIIMPAVILMQPTADYHYYSAYCPAGRVTFTDYSVANGTGIVDWLWEFEPGFFSSDPNPTYIFGVTGTTYPVSLIVTDANGCKDTIIQNVDVLPGFEFTFTNNSVCIGNETQFTPLNLAGGDTLHDVVWNFGEPSSGTNNTSHQYYASHTYLNSGTYLVKLRATNSDNCVDSVYREIVVYPEPIASFYADTVPYCQGKVRFHNLSSGNGAAIDSLIWLFGDGDTLVQVPPLYDTLTHTYAGLGNFEVTLTAINVYGCRSSLTLPVIVACVSSAFAEADTLKCAGQLVKLTDLSTPADMIESWQWDFGDGQDTTYLTPAPEITHSYQYPGSYNIKLIVISVTSGLSLSDTSTHLIVVKASPVAAFSAPPVCAGDTSRFINLTDSTGTPISHTYWKFGEPVSGTKDTSTLFNPLHHYFNPGKYTTTLVVRNILGCTDTLKQMVNVNKLPVASFTSSRACTRDYVFFTDETEPGDTLITNWFWTFGDPRYPFDTLEIRDGYHIYDSATSYSVWMKALDATGCWDTTTQMVDVLLSPTSSFTIKEDIDGMTGKIKLNNQSVNASKYDWDFGNGTTSKLANPIVTYKDDGRYLIRLVSENENYCFDTTYLDYEFLFHNLFVPNAFAPTSLIMGVRLFKPVGLNLQEYHVWVFDVQGHLMWESTLLDDQGRPMEGWNGQYNGNIMPQGTYMWKINATFSDGKIWEGSDIGKGTPARMGSVTLIR